VLELVTANAAKGDSSDLRKPTMVASAESLMWQIGMEVKA
jgi:hypothetical protein